MTTEPNPLDPFAVDQANQETVDLAATQSWANRGDTPTAPTAPEVPVDVRSVFGSSVSGIPLSVPTEVPSMATPEVEGIVGQSAAAASNTFGSVADELTGAIPSLTGSAPELPSVASALVSDPLNNYPSSVASTSEGAVT
jgi:hypothetical protein